MTNCGKMTFISKKLAASYINAIKASKKRAYKKQYPYKCTRCDYWHLTSQGKKQRRDYLKRLKVEL